MNTNALDRCNGCMGSGHQSAKVSRWHQEVPHQCRWIPIRYEDVTSVVRVRTTAARPAASHAAHHLVLAVGTNREDQAA
jgi:hypothetical protein